MKHDINRWVFKIPLDDIQEEFQSNIHGNDPCICCGKEIKNVKFLVHLVGDSLVSTPEPFADVEDLGFHPIGTGCKNKLPNNFYFKV